MRLALAFTLTLTAALLSATPIPAQRAARSVTLPVTVLRTTYGLDDGHVPTYPATITVDVPPNVEVAAYGAADYVWLGPTSWSADAAVGADGSEDVRLFPKGRDGRGVEYGAETGCEGCKMSDAAPFFPDALKGWNSDNNPDGTTPFEMPKGLVVHRVSRYFATFRLPDDHGLAVRGAVFRGDRAFQEIKTTLPKQDKPLADFLLKDFATRVVERFPDK